MYWNTETTVGDFIRDINSFIKLRLQLAEDRFGLPTMDRISAYIRDQVRGIPNSQLDYPGLCRAAKGYPCFKDSGYDFWLATMLTHETYGGTDARYVLVTRLSKEEVQPLLVIHLAGDTVTMEENDVVKIYRAASCEVDESTTMLEIFAKAIQLQAESNLPIQERWLAMVLDFRLKPPICPVCGSPLEVFKEDFGRGIHLSCCEETCCFYRQKNFSDISDFAEEKAFRREMRFFKKVQEKEQAMKDSLNTAKEALQKAQELLEKDSKYILNLRDTSYLLGEVQKMAEKSQGEIKTLFNRKG